MSRQQKARLRKVVTMAGADELLRDAQYAVHCISHGDTRENRAQSARAKSLAKKIVSRYPTSVEATQARSILDRLNGKSRTHQFTKLRHGVGHQRDTIVRTLARRPAPGIEDATWRIPVADSPEKLLRDAQHELHKDTYGPSYDNQENPARARSLARQIVEDYPDSDEANAARSILGEAKQSERSSRFEKGNEESAPDWQQILTGLRQLNQTKQAYIAAAVFILAAVVGFMPVVIGLVIFYLAGPLRRVYPPGSTFVHNGVLKQLDNWLGKNKAS
jgi:hypothetical protein